MIIFTSVSNKCNLKIENAISVYIYKCNYVCVINYVYCDYVCIMNYAIMYVLEELCIYCDYILYFDYVS